MIEFGFLEYQTPILTSSSPEGARDFLVPSRLNKESFMLCPKHLNSLNNLLWFQDLINTFKLLPASEMKMLELIEVQENFTN